VAEAQAGVAKDAPEVDTAAIRAVPPTPPNPLPGAGARQHGAPPPYATAPPESALEPAPDATPDVESSDGPVVGLTGARFGGARKRRKPGPTPRPAGGPATDGPPPPAVAPEALLPPDVEEPLVGLSAFVRPYVITRGRTRSSLELSIETLVSAAAPAPPVGLTGDHHAVLGLCREPRSVAEVAARAGVPLGVARVLVGDLAAVGAVAVHRGAGAAGPDLALMERVLSGLRKL
jgi:hypothetical protein